MAHDQDCRERQADFASRIVSQRVLIIGGKSHAGPRHESVDFHGAVDRRRRPGGWEAGGQGAQHRDWRQSGAFHQFHHNRNRIVREGARGAFRDLKEIRLREGWTIRIPGADAPEEED